MDEVDGQDQPEADRETSGEASPSSIGPREFEQLPDRVLARVVRGDHSGRPLGTPRNPRLPTHAEFNARITEVRAGDLEATIIARRHGLFPDQVASIGRMTEEELIRFRFEDPISAVESDGGLKLTGGHHRTAEIVDRVRSGRMSPDTIIRILLHD